MPVAFTTLVTVLPNDLHDTNKMRIATGAWWTFLSDGDLEVQRTLEIDEYTDPHHAATVPHTVVVAPGLVIDKVYCGYWFWGRPSVYQLWQDHRTCSAARRPTSTPPQPTRLPLGRPHKAVNAPDVARMRRLTPAARLHSPAGVVSFL